MYRIKYSYRFSFFSFPSLKIEKVKYFSNTSVSFE